MKDNFSEQSHLYEKYRPVYPQSLYNFLLTLLNEKQAAWDCGTGNGQVAAELSKHFEKVFATDISAKQLEQAIRNQNIEYSIQSAEQTNFPDNKFDLITIAQAIHWFNFDVFYAEVKRTAKDNAVICAIGYGKLTISKQIDVLIDDFYKNTIGTYWDKERRYIDERYQTIPFPFEEIESPNFHIQVKWNLEHLIGYLNTWSAVKHYIKQHQHNPVVEFKMQIEQHWGESEILNVTFPLFCRIGRIKK